MAQGRSIGRVEPILALAAQNHIPIKRVSTAQLDTIARNRFHQGIGATVSPYPLVEIDDILNNLSSHQDPPFLLLLDSIMDPQNLGALIRTALCAGVGGIIIPKNRAASPSPAVSKASAGALEHMRVAKVTNLVNTIDLLKAAGIWIFGMDGAAEKSIYRAALTGPIGIIIGGEEKGIRPLVKQQCDEMLSIPQTGLVGSLNASAAGAILMYEAFRQRKTVCRGH